MAPKTKQADRNAKKTAGKKVEEEEPVGVSVGKGSVSKLVELVKAAVMGSALAKLGPKVPTLFGKYQMQPAGAMPSEEKTEDETTEGEDEIPKKEPTPDSQEGMFAYLTTHLVWFNCLGLAFPANAEAAKAAWKGLKEMELDWGPRKARKGNPGLERILCNVCNNFAQYVHVLLAMMCLRPFLFRSWFACLPWLVGYQAVSLLIPVEMLPQVELKFRICATLAIHALVWLFFLYEVVWMTWFFEKPIWLGLIAFHAHSAKPLDS